MCSKLIDYIYKRLYNIIVDVSGIWYTSPKGFGLRGEQPSQYGGFAGSNPAVYTMFNFKGSKMKKALAIALSLLTFNASAQLEKSAYEMFSIRQNMMTNTSTITIRSVDNVREACEAESRKRGNGGFGFALNACAFWEDKKCTIIVGPRVNNDILGHEVRHCFQGNFH